jgi:hypothetical protein
VVGKVSQYTVAFELYADDTTYGAIIDNLIATGSITAVGLDLTTPSSASSPTLSLTFPSQNADDVARFFGCATWLDFVDDREPVVTIE